MPRSHHAEWLELVEVSGPFLSLPVLERVFPQGLDAPDPDHAAKLRLAHEEWAEERSAPVPDPEIHEAWIRFVLTETLEFTPEVILEAGAISSELTAEVLEQSTTLRPDLVLVDPEPRLSSSVHDAWARRWSGTHETRLTYSPTDCYENFPFPERSLHQLRELGREYLDLRRTMMRDRGIGLTDLYTRFHESTSDRSPDVVSLRSLQQRLDTAVVQAFGWGDLEVRLEHRMTEDGLRLLPDSHVLAEVLDRLLELNHERHEAEGRTGLAK